MQTRNYLLYDVFTTERLAGNPLAVVLDCKGLDTAAMQAIAREFNLSESVFVLLPDNPKHKNRIRIFTPDYEMPFAGHPTVGAAIALAELAEEGAAGIFVLEENIGPVRCAVSKHDGATFAEFDLAKLPEPLKLEADPQAIGAALGLAPHEIGFENHRVAFWSAGVPYVTIPVANLEAAGRVRLDNQAWSELAPRKSEWAFASPYVYCRETVNHESAFHVRMIVPGTPSYEDPATGSARPPSPAPSCISMPRPTVFRSCGSSRGWRWAAIAHPPRTDRARRKTASARIGGNAVKVAEGKLFV